MSVYELHRWGARSDKNNDIAGLMMPLNAITNFISPTCDYELNKFKQLTSHCFHMQYLTTTFLFTIIVVACEGSTSKNRQR